MAHWLAGCQAFRCIDDGVSVHAVMAIEIADRAGLAEMLDTQSLDAMPMHAAEPTQRRGMAVDYGDDASVARQGGKHFLDVAQMLRATAITAQLARCGPAGVQPIRRRDRQ